jgi:hypothetical protein
MNLSAKIATVEFAGDEVRVAVVKTGRRFPTILEFRTAPAVYSDPEDRTEALVHATRGLIEMLTSDPGVYVLCASSRYAVARKIAVPFRGRRRIAAAIPFELEPHLAFPVEELIVDHGPIREIEGETEVLVVGMRRDNLEEYLAVLEAAGVEVEGVGIDVAGLTALWQAGQPGASGLRAALHVCATGSVLVVVYGKALAFFRHLPYKKEDVEDTLSDTLVRDIENSLRSFLATWKGEDEIQELAVTGVPLSETDRSAVEETLDMPVRCQDLLDGLKASGGLDDQTGSLSGAASDAPDIGGTPATLDDNTWAAAIGVALGAAGASPAFDFRKGELGAANPLKKLIRHAVFSTCLALAAIIAYGAYCYVDFRNNASRIEQIGQETWDLFSEAFPDAEHIASGSPPKTIGGINQLYEALALEIQDMEERGESFPTEIFGQATLLDILRALAEAMPGESVTITDLKISPARAGSPRVDIKGEVNDLDSFNEAFTQLKKSTVLRIEEEPSRRNEAGKTTFTIIAGLKENARAQD